MSPNENQKSNESRIAIITALLGLLGVLITAYVTLVAAGKISNPFSQAKGKTSQIAGIWDGTIQSADNTFQTAVVYTIQPDCELGEVCGTYDTLDFGCKGDLIFKGVTQDIFEFTEVRNDSSAYYCQNDGIDRFALTSDGKLKVSYLYTDSQGNHGSSGLLTER